MEHSPYLVTGSAGFIGFHVARKLLESGQQVIGVDNLNDYYDVTLKEARLKELETSYPNFQFHRFDLCEQPKVQKLFQEHSPKRVVHLAAQVGVRNSLKAPFDYIQSNLVAFANLLEACRHNPVDHFVFASSSSVYGASSNTPYSVNNSVDHPISLYAATKKSNELMAHSYSHLFKIPCTGLRFFTVYGPWGRPDMAVFSFTKAAFEGRSIPIYNNGDMKRDFTYVDDIVDGVLKATENIATPNENWDPLNPAPGSSEAPYRIYNIGNNNTMPLMRLVEIIEEKVGKKLEKEFLPLQKGDVLETYADIDQIGQDLNFSPTTNLEAGVEKFVEWYKKFYF